ncbi:hypothetical protein NOV18_20100 [Pseudomonas asiatica]|uniref:Uncharacterized protein n=1 Tax=Pseudomonas asiatica TaxID=2219225 RepID=A0AAJ5IHS3_9PSED|nr:hypothetical protein [Pseudomonas asiatica]UUC17550.1 hypothetical protein NOV18_20100 [Pseudomonas asiatica]
MSNATNLKAILRGHLHEDRLQVLSDGLPLLDRWALAAIQLSEAVQPVSELLWRHARLSRL